MGSVSHGSELVFKSFQSDGKVELLPQAYLALKH